MKQRERDGGGERQRECRGWERGWIFVLRGQKRVLDLGPLGADSEPSIWEVVSGRPSESRDVRWGRAGAGEGCISERVRAMGSWGSVLHGFLGKCVVMPLMQANPGGKKIGHYPPTRP